MKVFLLRLQTFRRLGFFNIARVALYRFALKYELHPVVKLKKTLGGRVFFLPPDGVVDQAGAVLRSWSDSGLYFGWFEKPLQGQPPPWQTNVFSGKTLEQRDRPWWKIPDFGLSVGDIKTVWEASRFDWVPLFMMHAKRGESSFTDRLNGWLANWCDENPAYRGANWKCAQEASIRVLHLAMAARLSGNHVMTPDLLRLVDAHLARIAPTTSYAVAQDNNHGTSEAAALYIGGLWCALNGVAAGRKWARKGRCLLESRIRRLVADDGSFSQYSTNYHRVLLDTLSMVELWRRWREDKKFSSEFYRRARAATEWLYTLVEPRYGDTPNIGGNDGARLLPLTDTDYRDYRPSVQTAMVLFCGLRAYRAAGDYDLPLLWNDISLPESCAQPPVSRRFDQGGYLVLRKDTLMAVLKYPCYRFRPRHCDILHLDLWLGSDNLLRDAGSYRYNAHQYWRDYFTGVVAHNTIEFDGRDQMPAIGRFLKGAWPKAEKVMLAEDDHGVISAAAGYRDWKGAGHYRHVQFGDDGIRVCDRIDNFAQRAVLRWRLQPDDWCLDGSVISGRRCLIKIEASVPIRRIELVKGWESRYYYWKTPLSVLEVEVSEPGEIVTTVSVGDANRQSGDGMAGV